MRNETTDRLMAAFRTKGVWTTLVKVVLLLELGFVLAWVILPIELPARRLQLAA